jgi:hypothetical protein
VTLVEKPIAPRRLVQLLTRRLEAAERAADSGEAKVA